MEKKYIKVYTDLKTKIQKNILLPGDKLPTNKDLCSLYGVSLITIKKALELLKDEGYIHGISGIGTFITEDHTDKVEQSQLTFSIIVPNYSEVFCLEIINRFEQLCRLNNVTPLISRSFGDTELEDKIIKEHVKLGADGICIMPIHDEYFNKELLKLSLGGFPLITIDRKLPSIQISSIVTNNMNSSRILATYAKEKNYKYPFIITPRYKRAENLEQRVIGFLKHFEKHRLLYFDDYLPSLNQEHSDELNASLKDDISKNIYSNIDVIFCVEYNIANHVQKILNEIGSNIEVLCYDYPSGRQSIKFTHIKQNQYEIASKAFNYLANSQRLDNKLVHHELDGSLVYKNIDK